MSTWYTDPAFNQSTRGAGTAHAIPGPAAPSQSPCPPGTMYPSRLAQPQSFDQVTHWPGGPGQSEWVPNTSRRYVEPETWLSADAAVNPGHALWGSLPPSPVSQIAAGPLPYHWPPWLPTDGPEIHNQEPYDQLPVSAAYYPATSLPSPATFLGDESHSLAGFPLDSGNESLSFSTGQPCYEHGASASRGNYQSSTHELDGRGPLATKVTPKLSPFGVYSAATAVSGDHRAPIGRSHAILNDSTTALSRISGLELSGPHPFAVKKPDNEVRVKKEHVDQAEGTERELATAKVHITSPVVDGAVEASNSGNAPGKNSPDRKKRTRFKDESMRRETSNTRSMGACLRCHNQRVRVSHGPAPDGSLWRRETPN